jgi:probable phosphoglycerate mutase
VALDLYLARHGSTEWSRNGRHTGRTDLPLLPEGEDEARRLAPVLAGLGLRSAFVSDLGRARRTAQLAGFADATVTPLLREYDYGDYEGITTEQIHRDRPDWQLFRDGCPGGESPDQVYARAENALRVLASQEGPVVVFSHGHFLRALSAAWTELGILAAERLALDTGTLSVLREGDRGRVVQVWNAAAEGLGAPPEADYSGST